jgi:hypothetical protein
MVQHLLPIYCSGNAGIKLMFCLCVNVSTGSAGDPQAAEQRFESEPVNQHRQQGSRHPFVALNAKVNVVSLSQGVD